MLHIGNFVIWDWLGWDNPNTCLVAYFNAHGAAEGRNLGFMILPLHFWRCFYFEKFELGHKNKRINFGVGFFTIYWDKEG